MKSSKRFAVVMTIAIAAMVTASAAIWLAAVNRGRLIRLESYQTRADQTPAPAIIMVDAKPLKGFNVYVCGQLADQRNSLDTFVSQRGGQVQSQLDVGTDYLLLEANADTDQFARKMQEAKEMHIPAGDRSKLMRLAQLR